MVAVVLTAAAGAQPVLAVGSAVFGFADAALASVAARRGDNDSRELSSGAIACEEVPELVERVPLYELDRSPHIDVMTSVFVPPIAGGDVSPPALVAAAFQSRALDTAPPPDDGLRAAAADLRAAASALEAAEFSSLGLLSVSSSCITMNIISNKNMNTCQSKLTNI